MNKIISATQARKELFELIKLAGKPGRTFTITLEGHPPVALLSLDELEGWQETLEIMSDPDLMARIREGESDAEAGRTVTLEEFERELDTVPRVSRRSRTVGSKRSKKNPASHA